MDRFLRLFWYYKPTTIVLAFQIKSGYHTSIDSLYSCIFDFDFFQGIYIYAILVYVSHQLLFLRIFCNSSYVKNSLAESSVLFDVSCSSSHSYLIWDCLIVVDKIDKLSAASSWSGVTHSSDAFTHSVDAATKTSLSGWTLRHVKHQIRSYNKWSPFTVLFRYGIV